MRPGTPTASKPAARGSDPRQEPSFARWTACVGWPLLGVAAPLLQTCLLSDRFFETGASVLQVAWLLAWGTASVAIVREAGGGEAASWRRSLGVLGTLYLVSLVGTFVLSRLPVSGPGAWPLQAVVLSIEYGGLTFLCLAFGLGLARRAAPVGAGGR